MRIIGKVVISICVCLLASVPGAAGVSGSVGTWYAELSRPSFTPPDWTFGVVWPILYVLMGVSAFLVWHRGTARREVRVALMFFAFQLVLNALWTPIFFGVHMIGLALLEIVLLWIAIILTVVAFRRISRLAAGLLLPYLLWVSFAVVLNGAFWFLNR